MKKCGVKNKNKNKNVIKYKGKHNSFTITVISKDHVLGSFGA